MSDEPIEPGSLDAGTLYLVGTPLGNRGDLTPRSRDILAAVSVVACEDTRVCRRLFAWLGLSPPETVLTYHDHNAAEAVPKVLDRLLAGQDVALVSDAGMPAIQDPGYRLVVAARETGLDVVPVPGPSAVVLALSASGLPTDRFVFLGFAPRRGRDGWWNETLSRGETIVVYEGPSRILATVETIARLEPERRVCVARELTKLHEEFITGEAAQVARSMAESGSPLKGEFVLIVGGSGGSSGARPRAWPEALEGLLESRAGRRMSARDKVEILSIVYPGERNAIYEAIHRRDDVRGEGGERS